MTDAKQITGHIQPTLDQLVLEGARRLIQQALHEEIQTFLGRDYYEHHEPDQQKRYRNGYGRQRRIVVGSGNRPGRRSMKPGVNVPWKKTISMFGLMVFIQRQVRRVIQWLFWLL